jgi:hypothetical protein
MKLFGVVAALLAVALVVPGAIMAQDGGLAGISDTVQTGIQLQNVGSADTTATVSLYDQATDNVIELGQQSIPQETAVNYFLPTITDVTAGTYSLVASADQPIAAIVRSDFTDTGAAGTYSSTEPGSDVIVPLVLQAFSGQTSQLTVQNASTDQTTDYTIQIFGRGLTDPAVTIANETLNASESRTYDLADGPQFTDLPDTGADLGVTTGFAGYARITVNNPDTNAPLVVQSFIDLVGVGAVGAFSGVSAASAQSTLYIPLVRSNFFGDTGIQIVNPTGTDTTANITFYTDPVAETATGNDYDDTYTQSIDVPANSSAIAFQGPGGNSGQAGLPTGTARTFPDTAPDNTGWFGTAVIETTGDVGVLAVVNDTLFGGSFSIQRQSTYNGLTGDQAGTRFALPLVRSRHVTGPEYTTGIQVQNTSGNAGNVTVTITGYNNETQTIGPSSIAANGALNFYQGDADVQEFFDDVPADLGGFGWFGSAIVTSDVPIVMVVDDNNFVTVTATTDSANFTGLRIQQ